MQCNIIEYRSKNHLTLFHTPILYKRRQVLARSGSTEDHDYTPAPSKPEKECIELNPNEEEKDKDYYFMDTSLLGQLGINLYRLIIINC